MRIAKHQQHVCGKDGDCLFFHSACHSKGLLCDIFCTLYITAHCTACHSTVWHLLHWTLHSITSFVLCHIAHCTACQSEPLLCDVLLQCTIALWCHIFCTFYQCALLVRCHSKALLCDIFCNALSVTQGHYCTVGNQGAICNALLSSVWATM